MSVQNRLIFVDSAKCLSCKTCELQCAAAHSSTKTLMGAISEGAEPCVHVESTGGSSIQGFPLQCRHCEDAQCVKACATHALFRDSATGLVNYDPQKCLGCLMCVIACPFGVCEQAKLAANKSGYPADALNAVSKCDLCAAREGGPACVEGCPTGALSFTTAEEFSKGKRREYIFTMSGQKETKAAADGAGCHADAIA
jgi:carbon-monoxide dehydrogenase iron sulfur subunit